MSSLGTGRDSRGRADSSSASRKSGGFSSISPSRSKVGGVPQDEPFPGCIDLMIGHHRITVMLVVVVVVMQGAGLGHDDASLRVF